MQIAVITGPTIEVALPRIRLANSLADGVELRLDLFQTFTYDDVKKMRKECTGKMILTLRGKKAGGGYLESEEKKLARLIELLDLCPDYLDLEMETDIRLLENISHMHPNCKIISSYHHFERTPKDLEEIIKKQMNPYSYAYKICTTANSLSDSYRMLRLIQKFSSLGIRCIGLCMGDLGTITREEGIKSGNYLNYIILHNRDRCAPGLQIR